MILNDVIRKVRCVFIAIVVLAAILSLTSLLIYYVFPTLYLAPSKAITTEKALIIAENRLFKYCNNFGLNLKEFKIVDKSAQLPDYPWIFRFSTDAKPQCVISIAVNNYGNAEIAISEK